jgi:tRNA(Ile)-lysidine synthase
MLSGSKGAIVAVSGGPDSVAILDILFRLLDPKTHDGEHHPASKPLAQPESRFGTISGFGLTVAHLNHRLRGEASEEDARFVSELAGRLGLPAIIASADVAGIASKLKFGIEEAARAARYTFLFRAASVAGADRIVTGHTMNDQVETFIMRALRGSGTAGLAGMAAVRPAHQFEGLRIDFDCQAFLPGTDSKSWASGDDATLLVRPGLCVTREEVEVYCGERSLDFRVDASNLNGELTRNRIRQDVIPAICRIEPQGIRSISRAMELLASDDEALDQLADEVFKRAIQATDRDNLWPRAGGLALDAAVLAGQPRAILNRVIVKGLRQHLATGNEVTSVHISSVEALILRGRSGKRVALPGGIRVWREGRSVVIDSNLSNACRSYQIELNHQVRITPACGLFIKLERNIPGELFDETIQMARSEKLRTGRDWKMAVLDDSMLPDTLVVRPRRPGERAQVIGQSGVNKLKNLMINHRIPVSRRAFWPLASTRDGRYVWSPGLPPSVEFAANRETRALAILSATED